MNVNMTLKAQDNLSNMLEMRLFAKLSPAQLKQVRSFVNKCKSVDGYESPFHWDCIENRKNPMIHEILCYVNQKLAGFVSLYYFKDKEVEITILVQPEFREAKIFRLIWEQIKLTVHRNRIETVFYTFTLHQKDEKLIELLKDAEANRTNLVYKLVLAKKHYNLFSNSHLALAENTTLSFREAVREDAQTLIKLECEGFGTSANEYIDNLQSLFEDPRQKIFVVSEEEQVIGKIHFKIERNEAFMFDFCIFSTKQNKGVGNFLLRRALAALLEDNAQNNQSSVDSYDSNGVNIINTLAGSKNVNKIYLETDTNHYLKWYKKLGFKEIAVHEHWKLYYPDFVKYHDNQYRMLVLNHYQEYDLLA